MHYTTVKMSMDELKNVETIDEFVLQLKQIKGYDFILNANILIKDGD